MTEFIQNILYIIITCAGAMVMKYVMDFINEKIDILQTEKEIKDNELLNQYIDMVQQIVYDVVLNVTQTYVESLKSSKAFDEEAQIKAKEMAMTTAKSLISYEAKRAIIDAYGDFDLYISNVIESIVKQTKETN